ncbi:MAG: class I SAM-dependent methyltransferase, partial [Candidatus Thalassarchaeaceae archaeon]|nr:class I SAM-dependent methyltransferase [Candidatus Thalassarchaeaceae archaeon]
FELDDGTVYDIGCGNGEFLKVLCRAAPSVSGVGIDPSCHPTQDDNFRLTNETFENAGFRPDARLVILRHVLEHIDEPVNFLTRLRKEVPDTPFFIEVPDLNWILANGAFWDFTYEHCNYFTPPTLRLTLETAGFYVVEQQRSFGDQYQWAICRPADNRPPPQKNRVGNADSELAAVQAYLAVEADRFATISELAEGPDHFVIWGMSGKGVILASLLPEGVVSGGIDMNRAKQGRYAAASGLRIHSPEWLTGVGGSTVLVMNPNYATEIGNLVKRLGANARLITI